MSTRAQIELTNEEDRVLMYQHADGYPEWLVPNLIQKALRMMDNDLTNPGYRYMRSEPSAVSLYFVAAHFCNVQAANRKVQEMAEDPERVKLPPEHRWKAPLCSSFEFCDDHGLHGDIDWFYLAHVDTDADMDREVYGQQGSKTYPTLWQTEIFRPTKTLRDLPPETERPRYISEASGLVEKQGELLVTRKRIQYLGDLPKPGDLYEQQYETFDKEPAVGQLQVVWAHDWLVTVDATRIVDGNPEYRGTRKISPFGLREYDPVRPSG